MINSAAYECKKQYMQIVNGAADLFNLWTTPEDDYKTCFCPHKMLKIKIIGS